MSERDEYVKALREIATSAEDNYAIYAAKTLQKFDPKAHWCWEWDGLFIGSDSPEIEACRCFSGEVPG